MIDMTTTAGGRAASTFDAEDVSTALQRSAPKSTTPAPKIWATGLFLAASMTTSCFVGAPAANALALGDHTTRPLDPAAGLPASTLGTWQGNPTSNTPPVAVEEAPKPNTAELIQDLHDRSGLTWEQLSKILGVSRRSVHLWASGGRMNARHIELANELVSLVRNAPAEDPERVRAWLLAANVGGLSPVEEFKADHRGPGAAVNGVGYTASQLIGQDAD